MSGVGWPIGINPKNRNPCAGAKSQDSSKKRGGKCLEEDREVAHKDWLVFVSIQIKHINQPCSVELQKRGGI